MSRKDVTINVIKEISETIERGNKESIESSLTASSVINGQIAILIAELVDEICAIRKDLDELGRDVKRIERNMGKK